MGFIIEAELCSGDAGHKNRASELAGSGGTLCGVGERETGVEVFGPNEMRRGLMRVLRELSRGAESFLG